MIMGRLIIEVVDDDVEAYEKQKAGLSRDSKLIITGLEKFKIPVHKGKVLSIGDCCFGERFGKWYGEDVQVQCKRIKPGDMVLFVPSQTFAIDPEQRTHIISDEHVLGYITAERYNNIVSADLKEAFVAVKEESK